MDSRTLWCGNLSNDVTEELLYELFLQAGPVDNVHIPKDVKSGKQRTFGFVTFKHAISVPYAIDLMAGERLFNRPIILKFREVNGDSPKCSENPVIASARKETSRNAEVIVLDDDHSPQNVHYNDGARQNRGNLGSPRYSPRGHQDFIHHHHHHPHNSRQWQQNPFPNMHMDSTSNKNEKDERFYMARSRGSMFVNPWQQVNSGSPGPIRHHEQQYHHHRQQNTSPQSNRHVRYQ